MNTRKFFSIIFILLAAYFLSACAPDPLEVARTWSEALNAGDVETALACLADDAVITLSLAPPGDDGIYTGQAEIRGWYEAMAEAHGQSSLSDCQVEGDTVTCWNRYSDDGLQSMGVDFIEGTWTAVIADGKIQSYTNDVSPESLAKFAPPPEPADTPVETQDIASPPPIQETPTLALSPEQPVTSLDELLGVWNAYWSDNTTINVEFTQLRRAEITFPDGTLIGRDTFSIENGLLTWESVDESLDVPTACAANPVATYEVYITYRGDQPVSLRFVLVGEDACMERSLLFAGQTLEWVAP